MPGTAIKVEGIGKRYKIGGKKSGDLRETMANLFKSHRSGNAIPESPNRSATHDFWALRDISFEIRQGEAVGIIGRNGAGKSTLLKILSRITKPTTGRFEINGRVSSLLEVGTGFHMELTGRENIYLNGTILGMRRREIKAKFEEIVAFSGVEEFIDTPVKHYSSGMKVRLAFSVAAHLEPEILIIDEVLAVGDAEFQKKCLGKMEDVAGQGRTVLFVSHNMGAVKSFCSKSYALKDGQVLFSGDPQQVIRQYMDNLVPQTIGANDVGQKLDFQEVQLLKAEVRDENGSNRKTFSNHDQIEIFSEIIVKCEIPNFRFGITIEDQQSTKILSSYHNDITDEGFGGRLKPGVYSTICTLPKNLFYSGEYFVTLLLGIHQIKWVYKLERMLSFEIEFTNQNKNIVVDKRNSILAPHLHWSIQHEKAI